MATTFDRAPQARPISNRPPRQIDIIKRWLGRFSVPSGLWSWRPGVRAPTRQHGVQPAPSTVRHRYPAPWFPGRGGTSRAAEPPDSTEDKPSLEDLTTQPTVVLYKATAIFPFSLFPDSVTVDTRQVCVMRRDFFWAHRISSINHEDILNVTAESGPFFATLKLTTRFFSEPAIEVGTLSNKDAHALRKLIHGLVIARQNHAVIDESDPDKLREQLFRVGEVNDKDMP